MEDRRRCVHVWLRRAALIKKTLFARWLRADSASQLHLNFGRLLPFVSGLRSGFDSSALAAGAARQHVHTGEAETGEGKVMQELGQARCSAKSRLGSSRSIATLKLGAHRGESRRPCCHSALLPILPGCPPASARFAFALISCLGVEQLVKPQPTHARPTAAHCSAAPRSHFRLNSAARVCVLCLREQRVVVRVEKENEKAVGCGAEDHVPVRVGRWPARFSSFKVDRCRTRPHSSLRTIAIPPPGSTHRRPLAFRPPHHHPSTPSVRPDASIPRRRAMRLVPCARP